MAARWSKNKIISNEKIKAGDVIVGLASYGQAIYEDDYNSGVGSNGLTSARHDVLNKYYAQNFPESFDETLDEEVVYIGKHRLTDTVTIDFNNAVIETTIGKLILSPTRTYAPVMKQILENHFDAVHGLIHCSGGGQTKCMKYMPEGVRVIKDALFEAPRIFQTIQQSSGADDKEMYQVFNMGCRLEIYTDEKSADRLISTVKGFGIDAHVIGRVEHSKENKLLIKSRNGEIISYII